MTQTPEAKPRPPVWLVTASWREHQALAAALLPESRSFPPCRLQLFPETAPGLALLHTGMGPAATQGCLDRLLTGNPSAGLISVGYCGALGEARRNGDLLLYQECLPVDAGRPGDAVLPASATLLGRISDSLGRKGLRYVTVRAVTSPVLVACAEEKRRLGEQFRAEAVDMETSAVFHAARQRDLPCAGLRVVLDEAGHSLPELEGLLEPSGSFRRGALRTLLLQSPRTALLLRRLEKTAVPVLGEVARALATLEGGGS